MDFADDAQANGPYTSVSADDAGTTAGSSDPASADGNAVQAAGGSDGNAVAGNGNVPSPSNSNSNGTAGLSTNGNTNAPAQLTQALVFSLTNTSSLCLTASTNPPTAGASVGLAPCALTAAQGWWLDAGRVKMSPNLCLNNPAANQSALTYTKNGNTVIANLAPCDSSDQHQHIELFFGNVVSIDGSYTWALTARKTSSTAATVVWDVQRNTDGSDNSAVENPNQDWTIAGHVLSSSNQVTVSGFPIKMAGSANLCLDTSYGSGVLGAKTCSDSSATQKWTSAVLGNLTNSGKCIQSSNHVLSLAACSSGAVTQRWRTDSGAILGDEDGYYIKVASATATSAASMTSYTPIAWIFGWEG